MLKAVIHEKRCKGCSLCIIECPENIIVLNKDTFNPNGYHPAVITDIDSCIACGFCAVACPDTAIEVKEIKNG